MRVARCSEFVRGGAGSGLSLVAFDARRLSESGVMMRFLLILRPDVVSWCRQGLKKITGLIISSNVVLSLFFVGAKPVFAQPMRFSHFLSRLWEVGHVLLPSGGEHYLLPVRRRDDP